MLQYSWYARFAENIERFQALFPPERIKVLVLEEFQRDKPRVHADVLEFLGVSSAPLPDGEERNPHHVPRSTALTVFLRERTHWMLDPPRGSPWALALRARRRAYRGLEGWNWSPRARTPLAPEVRARLRRELEPEVRRLSELLGRDLVALWGYER
jgi:hypothetical protein